MCTIHTAVSVHLPHVHTKEHHDDPRQGEPLCLLCLAEQEKAMDKKDQNGGCEYITRGGPKTERIQGYKPYGKFSSSGWVFFFFYQCLFDGWFVCQQDYSKTIKQISTRLDKRVDFDPELTPSTFGADLDKRTDLGFIPFFNIAREFFKVFVDKLYLNTVLCGSKYKSEFFENWTFPSREVLFQLL